MDKIQKSIVEQIRYLQSNAVAKQKEGKLEEALNFYLEAVKVDETQPDWVYGNAILLLAQVGSLNQGWALGEKAKKLYPESDKVYQSMGKILYKADKHQASINYYQQAINLVEKQPVWVFADLVAQLVKIRKFDEAIEIARQGIELYPNSEWIYLNLGKLYEKKGNFNLAIEKYEKALNCNPKVPIDRRIIEKLRIKARIVEEFKDNSTQPGSEAANGSSKQLFILETYEDDPSGLGIVARRCFKLGNVVPDTKELNGKVLVPGRPDICQEFVSKNNHNYLLTTFESSKIPESWVESINNYYHEVFVPHGYVKKTFVDSGVNIPVSIIPHAYPQRNRTRPIERNKSKLKLGVLGVPNQRKNIDKLVEAVTQLNQENYGVELVIHCPWLLDSKQEAWGNQPNITLTVGIKSDEEIDEWYSNLDAYIYPSSGEGWSFTPRESMSLGIPTIVTDIPVHEELVESGFYLPLCSDNWEPAYYEFLKSICGEWKSYSVEQIKKSIIKLIQEYEHWFDLAQIGKDWVADRYQWDNVKKQLIAHISSKNLKHCDEEIEGSTHNSQISLEVANSLIEQNKINEVLASYQEILKISPPQPELYSKLGNLLLQQNQLEPAIEVFSRLTELEPNNGYTYYMLGDCWARSNRIELAIYYYRHSIEINPCNFIVNYNLAYFLSVLENYEESILFYRNAFELAPSNLDAYPGYLDTCQKLGDILAKVGKIDEASFFYRKVLEIELKIKN